MQPIQKRIKISHDYSLANLNRQHDQILQLQIHQYVSGLNHDNDSHYQQQQQQQLSPQDVAASNTSSAQTSTQANSEPSIGQLFERSINIHVTDDNSNTIGINNNNNSNITNTTGTDSSNNNNTTSIEVKQIEVVTSDNGQAQLPMYFDYNATTPLLSEVADAMLPFLYEHFGNPSSMHVFGNRTKHALEDGRSNVAKLIGAKSADEIVFVSGGSESINFAMKGTAFTQRALGMGNHIVASKIEHACVLESLKYLEGFGFEVTLIDVDEYGLVDAKTLAEAITPKTILVTVMLANNEMGSILPIAELCKAVKAVNPNLLFHTDGSQCPGKMIVNVQELGVDLFTLAGHKLYAPKGVGALYIKHGTPPLQKQIHGADHENGLRAGTENVCNVVGLSKACEIVLEHREKMMQHMRVLRDLLDLKIKENFAKLCPNIPISKFMRLNGHPVSRLCNTLSLSFYGIEVAKFMPIISPEIACSAGAACNEKCEPSHVLKAMKVPIEWARGTLRLSVGILTTLEEIERCAELLTKRVVEHSPVIQAEMKMQQEALDNNNTNA